VRLDHLLSRVGPWPFPRRSVESRADRTYPTFSACLDDPSQNFK
jgi:hypothetical protein